MKKLFCLALAIVVMLAAATAWGGESTALTKRQRAEIEMIIRVDYRHGVEIKFKDAKSDFLTPPTAQVECWASRPKEYLKFEVEMDGKVLLRQVYPASAVKHAEAIQQKIQKIINRPASEELGRNLLK